MRGKKKEAKASVSSSQQYLSSRHLRTEGRDVTQAKAINDRITEFIALDDQPFSVVED